jgi:thioredoxin 1
MPIEITDSNFEQLVVNSDKLVVIDLWAEWCGPCRMIAPHIEALHDEYQGKAVIGKLDVDSNPQIPSKYGVLNIPTILFFKNGQVVDKVVGAVPKKVIAQTIDKHL